MIKLSSNRLPRAGRIVLLAMVTLLLAGSQTAPAHRVAMSPERAGWTEPPAQEPPSVLRETCTIMPWADGLRTQCIVGVPVPEAVPHGICIMRYGLRTCY
jgi:hypothetical protein